MPRRRSLYVPKRQRGANEDLRGAASFAALAGGLYAGWMVIAFMMVREAFVTTANFSWGGRGSLEWSTDADRPFDLTLFAIAVLIITVLGYAIWRALLRVYRAPLSARVRALKMLPTVAILAVGGGLVILM